MLPFVAEYFDNLLLMMMMMMVVQSSSEYMSGGVNTSELVEHAWLDNLLDAQTTETISSGTTGATVLPSVESHHNIIHHHHQQQQQPQCVKSEHSYSLGNDNGVDFNVKIEPDEDGPYI